MNRKKRIKRSVSIIMLSSMMLTAGTPSFLINPVNADSSPAEAVVNNGQEASGGEQEGIRLQHTPAAWIPEQQNYTVTAGVYGNGVTWTGQIRYTVDGQEQPPVTLMPEGQQQDTYTGVIPGEALSGRNLEYAIEILDTKGKVIQSQSYSTIFQGDAPKSLSSVTTVPALLITEMAPDTTDLPGTNTDAYEFVEVYNNTDLDVNFKDYTFFYNNKDTWAPEAGADIIIPAHQSVVFWIMNGKNDLETAAQFNQNYGTNLTEGVNLFRIKGGGGMANASARTLMIKAKSGEPVVSASYEAAHVKPNMGVFFKHPIAGSNLMSVMDSSGKLPATPGAIDPDQIVPPVVDGGKQTEISHTPATVVDVKDLEIKAHVLNPGTNPDGSKAAIRLLYKTPSQARYTVTTMTDSGNTGDYTATIPAAALAEPTLDYRIQAGLLDKPYTFQVNMAPFDSSKAPALFVTELVPNTTNVQGTSTDAYEFIEVYNNSDMPVNFKNYKIYYRYPDKGPSADVEWPSTQKDFIIPSKGSVVFWIKNSANTAYTESDFNSFYKTSLVPGQTLQTIQSDGMANSGRRSVLIKTNTGREISSAYYDADLMYEGSSKSDETNEDKAILYRYPVNGGNVMIKASSGTETPTPGSVSSTQVPKDLVHINADTVPPTIKDMTGIMEVDQSKGLELKVDARDDHEVTSVEVYVRSDKQTEYTRHSLKEDFNDMMYHYKLSSADLIGRKYIEYYFVVSDGMNDKVSDPVKISVTGGPSEAPLRLNVKDEDILKGTHIIKGTSQSSGLTGVSLSVDGKKLQDSDMKAGLEHDAYFVFDAVNVDYYFKNAVTMGPPELEDKTILYTFMDPIETYTTLSFPISAERLAEGDNVIYIRAGSKTSPFDKRPEENKDDFEVKNVRLLLADGTEIWDPAYAEKEKQIKIGDSEGKSEFIGFHFDLKPEYLKAKTYSWDTTSVADGPHQVKVSDGNQEVTSSVIVDNTAPVIKPTLEEGKEYRGEFVIDADVKDAYAGVDKIIVKLDDKPIELPFTTSSGQMAGGAHKLYIQAVDKAGNISEKTVNFNVPDENPLAPQLISPKQGQTDVGTDASLTVKVQDPNQDPMKVTFYKGYKYDGNRAEGFKGYTNTSPTEPPKEMDPAGEKALSREDYENISAVDGKYLVNDSVEQFPYQRFEVKLDPSVKSTDRVEINWKGKSLEGRKVSLYAWSPAQQKWVQLDQVIAGADDFELNAVVHAGEYANGQVIDVMVQDEIAVQGAPAVNKSTPESQDPYDFSFVWMSDTQYYSQSYPMIYQNVVNWIVDQKEKMNIKYVIHTGDVVDKSYEEYQWQEADKDMKVLEDANIPYGVLAGNHDVDHQNNDYTKFKEYFGEDRFKSNQVYGGSYDDNRGHYDLVSSNGNDFIIVYMGWGLGEKEIDWMNEIVSKYPERKAILCLHEYLLVSNNRAPIADQIFEKVIKPNKNVIAALSGHYHDAELKVDQLDDNGDGIPDRNVYQMLADYQGAPEGGLGYIRLMQFDMKNNKLHIKTYSPYLDDYNYYDPQTEAGKDEFSLDLGLAPTTKRVATDYIAVKVYTDQQIGTQSNVKSGTEATVVWKGLASNSYDQWYVQAEDGHSGSVLSDIWGFYTGKETGEVSPPEGGGSTGGGDPSTNPGKPGVPPTPDPEPANGQITLEPSADGAYHADAKTLEKAITSTNNGKVVVELTGKEEQAGASAVYLPAAALKKAKDSQLSLIISAPGLTVTLPPASLPDHLEDADQLLLRIDTTMNETVKRTFNSSIGSSKEYNHVGMVYSLYMAKIKGQIETRVTAFGGPVSVQRSLTADQQKQLKNGYAGVYLLQDMKPVYKGGKWSDGILTFSADQPGIYAVLEYHKQFKDVKGSWAEEYIGKLTAMHLIQGMDEDHYGPSQNVTRADFVTLAMRAAGVDLTAASQIFKDVPADAYYSAAVAEASKLGFIQGSEGKFRPQDTISREEAAVILMKISDYMYGKERTGSVSTEFKDMKQVSPWAKEAVDHVNKLGLMNGKGNSMFDPQGEVTRVELAKMIYNLINP
ncbi:S-layer homology domain-containing protein [Paenibacillus sp. KQZ6P-2]|uniref:S-layer homology domain-containing protein n=1 Tax=Paenibacillus mangrovi TaxID=2931978 RepID=A0A9X1WSH6_9BACL|nr:S-layer homology domain-containing protein [Paenibacillus mangrovi]MCJ8010909.1 S-layer homology domain-containing protein [Paenibacillus mangrovi]